MVLRGGHVVMGQLSIDKLPQVQRMWLNITRESNASLKPHIWKEFFTFGPPADGREAPVGRLSRMYL